MAEKIIMANQRLDSLNKLIQLSVPLSEAIADLGKFEWDSEVALVQLKAADLRMILTKFLNKEMTAEEVERWANAIECRDDVDYSQVSEAIDVLANPLTRTPLTEDLARRLIQDYL